MSTNASNIDETELSTSHFNPSTVCAQAFMATAWILLQATRMCKKECKQNED